MIDENKFWEVIEENKDNPIEFYHYAESMSLKEYCEFYSLFDIYTKVLERHGDFISDMCIDYKIVNYVETELENGYIDYIFGSAYDYLFANIILRGKDLFEAFRKENQERVEQELKNINGKLSDEESSNMLFELCAIKVATDEELDQLDDMEVYEKLLDRFYITMIDVESDNQIKGKK